jgi:hypothetical protein
LQTLLGIEKLPGHRIAHESVAGGLKVLHFSVAQFEARLPFLTQFLPALLHALELQFGSLIRQKVFNFRKKLLVFGVSGDRLAEFLGLGHYLRIGRQNRHGVSIPPFFQSCNARSVLFGHIWEAGENNSHGFFKASRFLWCNFHTLMKPIVLILGTVWLLSLGAAFLIGQGARNSESQEKALLEQRSSSRPSSSSRASRGTKDSRDSRSKFLTTSRTARIVGANSPRQAVTELAQLIDPVERAKGFLALIETLEADEFLDVVADFRALGITEQRMSEYGMLLHAWAKADPKGALGYAMKHTGTPFARQAIMTSWSTDDPDAAIAFVKHQSEGANPLLVGIIRGIAPADLSRATGLLQELPYSRERGDALQGILPFVMENGADLALNWAAGLADPQLKSGALTYIMSDLADSEPMRAAELLITLGDNDAAVRVADDVAGSLARVDLEQAKNWSAGLDDDLRAEAVEGIIGHYASQDPVAASGWLGSLAGTINLDSAIRQFAWRSQGSQPELAADWIGQIQSPERRNEMYNSVLSRWLRSDPTSAEHWIQSTPDLPEGVRELPNHLRQSEQQRRDRSSR